MAINDEGQRADGVDSIEDDGTVVFTDLAVEILREVMGYSLAPLKFDDCDERAEELITSFRALADS